MNQQKIINELNQIYKFANYKNIKLIRSKEGIDVYSLYVNNQPVVLKMFALKKDKREITNYQLLQSIRVNTIKVLGYSKNSICLEDINESKIYRLGKESDLFDQDVIIAIAKWYKTLHEKGKNINHLSSLYNETNDLTISNIEFINNKLPNKVWGILMNHLSDIHTIINSFEKTLLYNDFYWTNLVVAKDISKALMFDYNLLGSGFRYSDIRNICSSLSSSNQKIFLKEYGEYNEKEKIVDDCISPIITLINAFKKEVFPNWAKPSLLIVESGELEKRLHQLITI